MSYAIHIWCIEITLLDVITPQTSMKDLESSMASATWSSLTWNSSRWSRSGLGSCTSCKSWSSWRMDSSIISALIPQLFTNTPGNLKLGHAQITQMKLFTKRRWRHHLEFELDDHVNYWQALWIQSLHSHPSTSRFTLRFLFSLRMVQTHNQQSLQKFASEPA